MYGSGCGKQIAESGAAYCPSCGKSLAGSGAGNGSFGLRLERSARFLSWMGLCGIVAILGFGLFQKLKLGVHALAKGFGLVS